MTFRIDDIGASSKQFEQYSKIKWANLGFLKKIWPFKAWGPYQELTTEEWSEILNTFKQKNIKPIIAITATWVEKDSSLTPFPQKFPAQAQLLKEAFQADDIIIANHGLSHCIIGQHLPRFHYGNRYFHREFWPKLDQATHTQHITQSQQILEDFFQKPITIFIPPGNIWSIKTYKALKNTNIKKVISAKYMSDSKETMSEIEFINDQKDFFAFHDRELKLYGLKWLQQVIKENE